MGKYMKFYYKLITKQDVTRSFVVNRNAIWHFFNVALVQHGDEALVYLKRDPEGDFVATAMVLHQDCRLLLKNKDFKVGDIAYFEFIEPSKFLFKVISIEPEKMQILRNLPKSNFYLSNTKIL